jgi:hypothetical protein
MRSHLRTTSGSTLHSPGAAWGASMIERKISRQSSTRRSACVAARRTKIGAVRWPSPGAWGYRRASESDLGKSLGRGLYPPRWPLTGSFRCSRRHRSSPQQVASTCAAFTRGHHHRRRQQVPTPGMSPAASLVAAGLPRLVLTDQAWPAPAAQSCSRQCECWPRRMLRRSRSQRRGGSSVSARQLRRPAGRGDPPATTSPSPAQQRVG